MPLAFDVHRKAAPRAKLSTPSARRVARGVSPSSPARCPCGGTCPSCAKPPATGGAGQSLPAHTRRQFETALGADFAHVRIHTGTTADSAAASRGAAAYAIGRDIFFRAHSFAPDTTPGRELLAHELAHVAQQTDDSLPAHAIGSTAAEDEADRAAAAVTHGARLGRGSLHRTERRIAAKADFYCDPSDHEGRPLIWFDRAAPARSWRPATGYAQERLNEQLSIVFDCLLDPACRSTLPQANIDFMESLIPGLTVPLDPDCKFGEQTERATKIVQGFYFKDPKDWDGMIGDKTWRVIDQAPPPPPGPTIPIPNVPPPPKAGPIFI